MGSLSLLPCVQRSGQEENTDDDGSGEMSIKEERRGGDPACNTAARE